MENNKLKSKCSEFTIRIVKLSKYLVEVHKESFLSQKLLKYGTSVGFLLNEIEFDDNKENLPRKYNEILKELNQTSYWLELLLATEYLDESRYNEVKNDINELNIIISTKIISNN